MLTFLESVQQLGNSLFGFGSRLNPAYLLAMVPIAALAYRIQKRTDGFWRWLLPARVYRHASTQIDIKLMMTGQLMKVFGLLNLSALGILTTYFVMQALGEAQAEPSGFLTLLAMALLYLTVGDFCTYWVHRGHHQLALLWPFHAVHHSAEVMSPLTVYRKHPVYDLVSRAVRGIVVGAVNGVVLALLFGRVELATLIGINVFTLIFNLLGANFRHSHIWIGYGRVFSRLFVSPAMHQIHHSLAREHWHKNYGEVFALWDWMFGTLYVPTRVEELSFGLSTPDGVRIAQPYPTLQAALVEPFREAGEALRDDARPSRIVGT